METSISLSYIAHNGSTQLHKEAVIHLPSIGTCIKFDKLKDHSCTGFFVIVSVECTKDDNSMHYEVVALETNEEIYRSNMIRFEEILTT